MQQYIRLFVEGKSDRKFLSDLIYCEFGYNFPEEYFVITGGWTRLFERKNIIELQRVQDEDGVSLVIFDADKSLISRRNNLLSEVKENLLNIELFLFPDNISSGDLESLLLSIANKEKHEAFFRCFDEYINCLQVYSDKYEEKYKKELSLPPRKACVFEYLEIHNQETKEEKRDYTNATYWNLDSPHLDPLKDFLRPFFT